MSAREGPTGATACSEQPAPLASAGASTREVGWVAREARALAGSDDEQRRARFVARKRALLDYIEATTDEAADDRPDRGLEPGAG